MKTYIAKSTDVVRGWHLIDADGQILGRLATKVADLLRGKHKVIFTPHVDTGDFVIVINASKIKTTGNKLQDKIYRRHSLYPGGLREVNLETMMKRKPELVIKHAVKGMLSKSKLGDQVLTKLKIYAGPTHPHAAQLAAGKASDKPATEHKEAK